MESNKNDNNDEGDEHEQLRRNAQKRKLNELTNDEGKPAAGDEDQPGSSKKNRKEKGNDLDLELESLSREELIKLVRTQMAATMEAQKQMEAAKKEADEKSDNAKQRHQEANTEIVSKMEEFKRAILAGQQKAQELTAEMAKLNEEYQTLLEIVQLPHETAEGIAETEKQAAFPTHRPIKIQLAKETWFCLLGFVPRHQLGQIVPRIGDRQFAGIAQSFLHDEVDNKVTLGNIWIYRPCDLDANGHPQLRVWPKYGWYAKPWRTISQQLVLPASDVPMPENIKDFVFLRISYLDPAVLNFLRQFHQNSLFENVNLDFRSKRGMGTLLLSYVLPLIKNNINSIHLEYSEQLHLFYDADSDIAMDSLKMPRILEIRRENYQFWPEKINLLKLWLCTPREDGKPRVVILRTDDMLDRSTNALYFIDNIKMEFSKAKTPVNFFIRLFVRESVEWNYDCNMENVETKEKLVIKMMELSDKQKMTLRTHELEQKMALISRYPLNADSNWIEENEREAMDWDFNEQNSRIWLDYPFRNAIPHNFEHSFEGREAHYRNIRLCDCFSSNANDGREDQSGSRDNDGDRRST